LGGCSGKPPAAESKNAGPAVETIQGQVRSFVDLTPAGDGDLNSGGPSLKLWQGKHLYRLFMRRKTEVIADSYYVAEGINAQKAIDEIGDPDQGAKGYPLLAVCERVVKTAWPGMAFDEVDVKAAVLKARVSRYPARTVFLVTKIRLATPAETSAASADAKVDAEEKALPTVAVPADKQRALLIEGAPPQKAPLWDPKAAPTRCKLVIGPTGKVSDLETGAQLCESVDWTRFSYKPTLQRGKPVNVSTEVEVRFDPRT
jgi:hypothetical protein